MKKENSALAAYGAPTVRITRARAAACHASGAVIPLRPPVAKPDKKQVQCGKTKRDENNYAAPTAAFQHKKRAVLRDVTNISCENSFKGCIHVTKIQTNVSQRVKSGWSKGKLCSDRKASHLASGITVESALVLENQKAQPIQEELMLESQETDLSFNVKENAPALQNEEVLIDGDSIGVTALFEEHTFREGPEIICHTKHVKDNFCKDPGCLADLDFIDIDSDHANPQMCCLYSSEIYAHLRAAELLRRPCSNFMETVQRDITHSMRGILIDWLVEVSDEYKLVPDTLYLTVNIIDRFLSQNYIERQRLQLLGITCMLIASLLFQGQSGILGMTFKAFHVLYFSEENARWLLLGWHRKYEEIIAPPVEEFCFITDNTYTKREVLQMEIQVLRFLGFQLSVPTIKTFLRRFIRAAHVSYKVPPQTLSHLANYLAELTLVDCSFLKFLPSVIAASAVFLARWTLEQSDHPWNRTLEHYTSYKALELQATILAMQELQLNSNNCTLTAVREKYKQSKFESVAALTSPTLLQSLFR